ncbi:hypothetical protein EDB84DRAFT_1634595 [Lactarius hengduanensis]|nr:hypothetical protein EDB84DRAFT_1634595 [Lactarius hengduanensis]
MFQNLLKSWKKLEKSWEKLCKIEKDKSAVNMLKSALPKPKYDRKLQIENCEEGVKWGKCKQWPSLAAVSAHEGDQLGHEIVDVERACARFHRALWLRALFNLNKAGGESMDGNARPTRGREQKSAGGGDEVHYEYKRVSVKGNNTSDAIDEAEGKGMMDWRWSILHEGSPGFAGIQQMSEILPPMTALCAKETPAGVIAERVDVKVSQWFGVTSITHGLTDGVKKSLLQSWILEETLRDYVQGILHMFWRNNSETLRDYEGVLTECAGLRNVTHVLEEQLELKTTPRL